MGNVVCWRSSKYKIFLKCFADKGEILFGKGGKVKTTAEGQNFTKCGLKFKGKECFKNWKRKFKWKVKEKGQKWKRKGEKETKGKGKEEISSSFRNFGKEKGGTLVKTKGNTKLREMNAKDWQELQKMNFVSKAKTRRTFPNRSLTKFAQNFDCGRRADLDQLQFVWLRSLLQKDYHRRLTVKS